MLDDLAGHLTRVLAARPRRVLERPEKIVAAVLVPLVAVDGEPHLLFTRRSAALRHHQGQVSFPGGRLDAALDTSLEATALREAEEEIGLAPHEVQLLGALDDIETISTQFVITPFVGLVAQPRPWRPDPREVDTIFTVPVRYLRTPGARRRETWDFQGHPVEIDLYAAEGHIIWGATQRITRNLLGLLEPIA
jgi:8-oxo-dGTP pyrophosphatase MutT (NUDIX family)